MEEQIFRAIGLAKAGNEAEAKQLLAQVVKQEPDDARAWYLLSQVSGNSHDARYCLEQVLRIQPDNAQARERLDRPQAAESAQAGPKKKSKWTMIGLVVAGSFMLCCCAGGLVALGASTPERDFGN